jgi:hypothetical protein
MTQASRLQLVDDIRRLIVELERLRIAYVARGNWASVRTVDAAIEGTRRVLARTEKPTVAQT